MIAISMVMMASAILRDKGWLNGCNYNIDGNIDSVTVSLLIGETLTLSMTI